MTVVTTTILDKADKPMTSTYELMSVDIERTVNRVPRCSLKLLDGDVTKGSFPISDEALFAPGAEITVKVRYDNPGAPIAFTDPGEPNRLPRAYHSGDSAELDWLLPRIVPRMQGQPVHAVD